jgi:hypothetical protein
MDKLLLIIISTVVTYFIYTTFFKSNFNDKLVNQIFTNDQPLKFAPLSEQTNVKDFPDLVPPVVPEEIGLAMVYPQGQGVGMSKSDSNSFEPGNPGPLLTDYTIPESYGQSSLTDVLGNKGSEQSARILKIQSTGNQLNFKPMDETGKNYFSAAYTPEMVDKGVQYLGQNQPINYQDSYNPSESLTLQASPGMYSTLDNCEQTYPNTTKYNNFCITKGDIPYGQTVNNEVNPRLVDRWESFTGDYSRQQALAPIDGTLYPTLGVLAGAA